MTRMSPFSKRIAARRAALVTDLTRSLPGRISGIPGTENSRSSGVAPELATEEERGLDRFAMSIEEESYATLQILSPAEMPAIKKSGGCLMFSKRPPGKVFVVRLASGYVEACPPCLSCPWAACCPAFPSAVPAAVVAADFAAVSAVPAG